MGLGKLLANLDGQVTPGTPSGPAPTTSGAEGRPTLRVVGAPEASRFLDDLGDQVRIKLVDQIGSATSETELPQEELRRLVGDELERLIRDEKLPLNDVEQQQMVTAVTHDILGYGPIEPLLEDDTISEVMAS